MKLQQVQQPEPMVLTAPALREALTLYLRAKNQSDRAATVLEHARKALIEVYEETGELRSVVDGVNLTWVFPEKSTLDKKKLLAQGVTMAQIEAATTTKPTKPYVLITPPEKG